MRLSLSGLQQPPARSWMTHQNRNHNTSVRWTEGTGFSLREMTGEHLLWPPKPTVYTGPASQLYLVSRWVEGRGNYSEVDLYYSTVSGLWVHGRVTVWVMSYGTAMNHLLADVWPVGCVPETATVDQVSTTLQSDAAPVPGLNITSSTSLTLIVCRVMWQSRQEWFFT